MKSCRCLKICRVHSFLHFIFSNFTLLIIETRFLLSALSLVDTALPYVDFKPLLEKHTQRLVDLKKLCFVFVSNQIRFQNASKSIQDFFVKMMSDFHDKQLVLGTKNGLLGLVGLRDFSESRILSIFDDIYRKVLPNPVR